MPDDPDARTVKPGQLVGYHNEPRRLVDKIKVAKQALESLTPPKLTPEDIERFERESQQLHDAFQARTKQMEVVTPSDMRLRLSSSERKKLLDIIDASTLDTDPGLHGELCAIVRRLS